MNLFAALSVEMFSKLAYKQGIKCNISLAELSVEMFTIALLQCTLSRAFCLNNYGRTQALTMQ